MKPTNVKSSKCIDFDNENYDKYSKFKVGDMWEYQNRGIFL